MATDVHVHDGVHVSMTEINALFDSRQKAERAVESLRDRRYHAEDVTIWQPQDHPLWAFDDQLGKDARFARKDALIAGMIGATVMGTVSTLLAPASMGTGMALVLGAFLGFGFGGMLGAMFGLQMAEPLDDDPLVTITPSTGQFVLTFVTSRPTRARRVVASSGGRLVSEPGHNLPVTS
jgi:hypothetical protein